MPSPSVSVSPSISRSPSPSISRSPSTSVSISPSPSFTSGTLTTTATLLANADDGSWQTSTAQFTNNSVKAGMDLGLLTWSAFIRFDSVNVPQGANINWAGLHLQSTSLVAESNNAVVTVKGGDDDDQAAPTTYTYADSANKTTASTSWQLKGYIAGQVVTSPDLAAIIQEIVDRPGWVSGNAIVIYLLYSSGTYNHIVGFNNFDSDTTLTINYDYVFSPSISASPSVDVSISMSPSISNSPEVYISPGIHPWGRFNAYWGGQSF